MKLGQEIVTAIAESDKDSFRKISDEINRDFGTRVPPAVVKRIVMQSQRAKDIGAAKDKAASTVGEKVELMEEIGSELLEMFRDEVLDEKTRLDAVKELRQWTKLNIDTSGIHDDENNVLFVVDQVWDMSDQNE